MSNATICPEILICDKSILPDIFDKLYMSVAANHIKICKSLGLRLEMCRQVMDSVIEHFPWGNIQDEAWKQYLFDWYKGIISELDRVSSIHTLSTNKENQNGNTFTCVIKHQICKQRLFRKWLENWRNGHKYKDRYTKGIGTQAKCNMVNSSAQEYCLCSEFHIVAQYIEWKYVRYPWLLLYDKRLPVGGEFPFQPQRNWMTLNSAPKGKQHGFIDNSGNEWCWDASHSGHWDIQLSTSRYIRVNQDGQTF